MLGPIYLRLHKAGLLAYDKIVKEQNWFWCPLCDTWFEGKKLESVLGHVFFNMKQRMTVAVFGVCEVCLQHAGRNPIESVKIAVTDRAALRAGAKQEEPFDPRMKSVIMTEDEVPE